MQLTMAGTASRRPLLMLVTLALLVLAVATAALLIGASRRTPTTLPGIGPVVYAEGGELYVVDGLDGTPRRLEGIHNASEPALSAQGDRIAYFQYPGEGSHPMAVTAVRADGSGVTELAALTGWSGLSVAWSPDATSLLASTNGIFENGGGGTGPSTWRLAIVAADGSGFRMVDAGPGTTAGRAAWRPDGRSIAFVGYTSATTSRAVYLADPDGTNVRPLTGGDDIASNGVAWSPDGARLAFLRYRDDRTVELATAEVDAAGTVTNLMAVPPDPAIGDQSEAGPPVEVAGVTPAWSPDGTRLAYGLIRGSTLRVGIVGRGGTRSQALDAPVSSATRQLRWSPDGRSLVIVGDNQDDTGLDGWLLDLATGAETEADQLVGDWLPLGP